MTAAPAVRRTRRALVVMVGTPRTGDQSARVLTESLGELGVEATYVGHHESAASIAAKVAEERADAVELCMCGSAGVPLLRDLLRQLLEIGRRDVSIVVHRVD
jgi:methylmalonyl-CoA mutase cobalamin-binding domain/chain